MTINLPNEISAIINDYPELEEYIKDNCSEYVYGFYCNGEIDTPLNRTIISEIINERVQNLIKNYKPIRRNDKINDILDISYNQMDKQSYSQISINIGNFEK